MPNARPSKPDDGTSGAYMREPAQEAIAEAASLIATGQLVAFPTETVYGLGADATNGNAVARIFEAKGRPRFNPLIVHVRDFETAQRLGRFPELAVELAKAFWPGPLTLVVKRRDDCRASDLVSAGLDTIALRAPSNPVAQQLLATSDRPIAAPSANRSGHVSATLARHVADDLGDRVAMILDGGATTGGVESTVISLVGEPALLRPGAVPAADVERVLGKLLVRRRDKDLALTSPGQLESHYAPRATLRLDADEVYPGEALLAFGEALPIPSGRVLNLSPRRNLVEAAANLFAALRTLDAEGASTIAVMRIPDVGLGEAINDRLRRAAAPRPSAT